MRIKFLNSLYKFILATSTKYKIDESHDILHSMNVLYYAHNIFENEKNVKPAIESYKDIIYVAASIHDMCDSKYMNEKNGLNTIQHFLQNEMSDKDSNAITSIISTMSYTKVKKEGFPNLGVYQDAYHIVREADLLSSYDFDRCIIYDMKVNGNSFENSFYDAENVFNNRVLKLIDDGLFTTEYAKSQSTLLHSQALNRINTWKNIVRFTKKL